MERNRIELGRTESDIYCGGTDGGEAQRRGAAVEQRITAAVARRRDWLWRWTVA